MGASGLGSLLVQDGLLTEADRQTVKKTSGVAPAAFAKGIVALGLLSEDELATFITRHTHIRLASRNLKRDVDPEALAHVDPVLMTNLEVVPLRVTNDGKLEVAMADPLDQAVTHQLQFFTERQIVPVIATISQIRRELSSLVDGYKPHPTELEVFLANHVDSAARQRGISHQLDTKPSGKSDRKPPPLESFADVAPTAAEQSSVARSDDQDLISLASIDGDEGCDAREPSLDNESPSLETSSESNPTLEADGLLEEDTVSGLSIEDNSSEEEAFEADANESQQADQDFSDDQQDEEPFAEEGGLLAEDASEGSELEGDGLSEPDTDHDETPQDSELLGASDAPSESAHDDQAASEEIDPGDETAAEAISSIPECGQIDETAPSEPSGPNDELSPSEDAHEESKLPPDVSGDEQLFENELSSSTDDHEPEAGANPSAEDEPGDTVDVVSSDLWDDDPIAAQAGEVKTDSLDIDNDASSEILGDSTEEKVEQPQARQEKHQQTAGRQKKNLAVNFPLLQLQMAVELTSALPPLQEIMQTGFSDVIIWKKNGEQFAIIYGQKAGTAIGNKEDLLELKEVVTNLEDDRHIAKGAGDISYEDLPAEVHSSALFAAGTVYTGKVTHEHGHEFYVLAQGQQQYAESSLKASLTRTLSVLCSKEAGGSAGC